MYHTSTIIYRPEVRASRKQHGKFRTSISDLVDLVLRETEIVESDNPAGKRLFGVMDTFFSYGLLSADRSYWRCIEQFMPRAERQMLSVELQGANDRYMSLGWLKTAFNKGTLHFQMLALTNHVNKTYLTRFYHKNSCMRNAGLLESVTELIGKLQTIQFAFYLFDGPRNLRPEPAQAVIVETATVQLSSRAAARQRKLTENEASIETVLNIVPTEIPAILTAAIDQDVMLDQLVINRRNRLNSEHINAQKAIYEEKTVAETVPEPVKEEKLEDVMVKTMSSANMSLEIVQPLEEVLAKELAEVDVPVYKLGEGEYQIQQGDILHLAIHVFEQSSERVIETFKVYLNFYSSSRLTRFFVMTNYNFYVLRYEDAPQDAANSDRSSPIQGVYKPEIRVPHDRVRKIKIGCDFLAFAIETSDHGYFGYENDKEVEKNESISYWIAVGSQVTGERLVNAIKNVTDHTSRSTRSEIEFDDQFDYTCLLQPSVEKLLKKPLSINTTAMCYSYDHYVADPPLLICSGYLYRKNINDSNWLMKSTSTEVEQRYCVLIDSKMYNFLDSSCTNYDIVIDFKKKSDYCPQEHQGFTIASTAGFFEFETIDSKEHAKWLKVLSQYVDYEKHRIYASPSLAVFTNSRIVMVQEGEKFWQDSFLRLLEDFDVSTVKECYKIYRDENPAVCNNETSAFCIHADKQGYPNLYYMLMRYPSEVDRMAEVFQEVYGFEAILVDEEYKKDPRGHMIYSTCCTLKNLWPVEDL